MLGLRKKPAAKRRRRPQRLHHPDLGHRSYSASQLAALYRDGWSPATVAVAQYTRPEALTAAATRIETGTSQDIRRLIQPWQARALTYYDMIGEVNFASQFYSRTLAKVRLFPATLDENGDAEESDDKLLNELWSRVQDPAGGRSELQASYGRLVFVIGEGYLTCTPDRDWGEKWEFLSPDELRVQPGGIYVRYRAPQIGTEEYVNAPDDAETPSEGLNGAPDEVIAYRLWKKHPRYSWWADSSMHAVLDICEELLLLTLAVRSQAKSRAANNGLLLWPDESSNPQLDAEGDEDPMADPFFEQLAEGYWAPIADPGSASAGTPMMVRMAADLIPEINGGPRFLALGSHDAYAETGMRSELVRRFAMGVDLPPEQLLGLQDSNHWSSWLVDEQTWKAHLMPVTQQMCNDFNSAYLRPAARDAGFGDWRRVVIGYDATEVINHPDKGKDFLELYNARAIGKKALREAKGATDDDAPTDDELMEMIGVAIRDGSLAAYGIPSVRTAIEPEAGEIVSPAGTTTAPTGPETGAEVEPGPPAAGEPDPRQPITSSAAWILGAAELAVDRCRELAGSKIITRARNAKCQPCLDATTGIAAALVAAHLGTEQLEALQAPAAAELVAGGTRGFVALAHRLGLNGDADRLAALIEQHAANTLTHHEPPDLPEAFHAAINELLPA